MFLTTKKIKDWNYLYIIKCFREKGSKRPKIKTIKYIGNIDYYSKKEINLIRKLLNKKDQNVFYYIDKLKRKKAEENKLKKNKKLIKLLTKKKKANKKKIKKKIKPKNKYLTIRKKGKCVICGFETVIHSHHIIPVSRGGSLKKDNLIDLCPNHHAMAHRGLIKEEQLLDIKNSVRGNKILV